MKPKRSRRVRQEAGAGRRSDDGERRELEGHTGCPCALADHDVDAEVFHREVQHLLGGARHAVDLVDEEKLARHEAREHGREVAGVLQRGPARQADGPPGLLRHDERECRLAEARRPSEENVVWRAALHGGRLEEQFELDSNLCLADELGEVRWPERALERDLRLRLRRFRDARRVGHERLPAGPSSLSVARSSVATSRSSSSSAFAASSTAGAA